MQAQPCQLTSPFMCAHVNLHENRLFLICTVCGYSDFFLLVWPLKLWNQKQQELF